MELQANTFDNTCQMRAKDDEVNLKEVRPLLSFQPNETIPRGLTKVSGKVNINRRLEYITLSCSIVDSEQVVDRYGEPSEVIAVLPVDTSQRLNGAFTKFEAVTFSCPVNNGSYKQINFCIKDNLPVSQIKLYLTCECLIE